MPKETPNGARWNERLAWWIINDLFKHPQNEILPRHLYCLRILLQPITWLRWKLDHSKDFSYDMMTDTFTIYGMQYSSTVFKEFGIYGMKVGTLFELESRNYQMITIREIHPHIVYVGADTRTLSNLTIRLDEPEAYYIFRKREDKGRA